jgi:hypothetical protein
MAKVTFNAAVEHIHGKVGHLVFKESNGRDIVAKKPDQASQPNSPAQMAQRENFRQAAVYAKGAMQNTQAHDAYAARARELRSSPFAVAVKDWMTEPEVTAIDLTRYNKHVGDVTVAIADSAHAPVETGAATFDAASGSWKYTATADASAKSGLTVTATATDRPGNTGTLDATAP